LEARRERREEEKAEKQEKRVAKRERARERRIKQKDEEANKKSRAKERKYAAKERAMAEEEWEKLKKAARRWRDPNSPSKPPNAYALFASELFKKAKEGLAADAKVSITAVAKDAGKRWKEMTKEQQQPYADRAAEARRNFEIALKQYEATVPQAPSRPLTPYLRFVNEKRSSVKGVGAGKEKAQLVIRDLARDWRALPHSEKLIYESSYKNEKPKYEAARQKYVVEMVARMPAPFRDMPDVFGKSLPLLPGFVGVLNERMRKPPRPRNQKQ